MDLDDAGCRVKYLIRDRDGKYPALFDAILADAGITVVLSGVRIPQMNSIIERWIQACRHELLDRTQIWNQAHLLQVLREYEQHHTSTALIGASPTPDHCSHCPHQPPNPRHSRACASAAMTGSTDSSMPLDQHGRNFRHPQRPLGVYPDFVGGR
jgi:transposase InsO family protein